MNVEEKMEFVSLEQALGVYTGVAEGDVNLVSERSRLQRWLWKNGGVSFGSKSTLEPGDVVFKRGPFKKRYIVFKVDSGGRLRPTNAEVRYRKSRKLWEVFIGGQPSGLEFKKLASAKCSLKPSILDKLAAEAMEAED